MKLEHGEPGELKTTKKMQVKDGQATFHNGVLSKIAGRKVVPQDFCFQKPIE